MKNKQTIGSLLLLFTAMIWGAAFAAQRAGRGAIEPFSFVAARMALSAAAVGIPVFILRRRRPLRTSARSAARRCAAGSAAASFWVRPASSSRRGY